MKKFWQNHFLLFSIISLISFFAVSTLLEKSISESSEIQFKKLNKKERKKARSEYFFNIMRDPATNSIPENIRRRELEFAKKLQKKNSNDLYKNGSTEFVWTEVGPNDIGGRTRALAIDVTNSNTIIAGGVSGGIWKSIDNGETWQQKSGNNEAFSITSIVQDPRNGFTNIWYACGGEINGNSASDRGFTARYYGNGLFKSIDNGETWTIIENSKSNPTKWDSNFDYMSKLLIHPTTGSLFAVANGLGIIKSTDGGVNFNISLGALNDHYYSDIIVKSDGTLIGVISDYGFNETKTNTPGIYKSTNNGFSWTNITPLDFPSDHHRSVLGTSKLFTPIFYILTYTGNNLADGNEDVKLFKLSLDNSVTENLTTKLPKFDSESFEYQGHLYSQSSYNLAIAVKPDDDNFVLIAGTSLFRSTDGFSTAITNPKLGWIGGYHSSEFFYPNLHPDIHIISFDPNNSNQVWVGHDGGLSFTNNISDISYSQFFPWINKNNGYNVTQFYTVSIPSKADDFRIMGGTQDNGTPFFRWNNLSEATSDLSSGDGSYSHFTSGKFAYTSIYDGQIYRLNYDNSGIPSFDAGWTEITPLNATGQLFINPFVIDANKENIMYYPAGNSVWKNAAITLISPYLQGGTESGWIELANMKMPDEYSITAINVTSSNPTNLLYYAGYKENEIPKIYKLESANSATTGNVDVSIQTASLGAYIHYIAINPENGNEIIVVLSNYNIASLFHSTDGGQNYTEIEGNLAGDETNPGPSIRSAIIHPYNNSTYYFVGTSTGLYSATNLNGANTIWEQESPDEIGNVIVEFLDARTSDGTIAVATHGRGLFIGKPNGAVNIEDNVKIQNEFVLNQNYPNPFNPTTKINFTIPKSQNVKLNVFNSNGELVKTMINKNLVNGNYSVDFDGGNFASGIYYYRLETDKFTETRKMLLLK